MAFVCGVARPMRFPWPVLASLATTSVASLPLLVEVAYSLALQQQLCNTESLVHCSLVNEATNSSKLDREEVSFR